MPRTSCFNALLFVRCKSNGANLEVKVWAPTNVDGLLTPGPYALQLSKMTPQASIATNFKGNIRLYSIDAAVVLMGSPGL
jgi:hypothetical protein